MFERTKNRMKIIESSPGTDAASALDMLRGLIRDLMELNHIGHISDLRIGNDYAFFEAYTSLMNALLSLYNRNKSFAGPFIQENEEEIRELENALAAGEAQFAALTKTISRKQSLTGRLQDRIRDSREIKEEKEATADEMKTEMENFERWLADFQEKAKVLTERHTEWQNRAHCLSEVWRRLDNQTFLHEAALDPDTKLSEITGFTDRQLEVMAEDIQLRINEFQKRLAELIKASESISSGDSRPD